MSAQGFWSKEEIKAGAGELNSDLLFALNYYFSGKQVAQQHSGEVKYG